MWEDQTVLTAEVVWDQRNVPQMYTIPKRMIHPSPISNTIRLVPATKTVGVYLCPCVVMVLIHRNSYLQILRVTSMIL